MNILTMLQGNGSGERLYGGVRGPQLVVHAVERQDLADVLLVVEGAEGDEFLVPIHFVGLGQAKLDFYNREADSI